MEDPKPVTLGPLSTGSLLKSSEGVSLAGMLTLCSTICTGDFDPRLQMAAIVSLGVAMAGYSISRGMAKKAA
jgi:hypothetical protein